MEIADLLEDKQVT